MQIEFTQLHCTYCLWLLATAAAAGLLWSGILRFKRGKIYSGIAAVTLAVAGFVAWWILCNRLAGTATVAGLLVACVVFFYAERYADVSAKTATVLTLLRLAVLGMLLLILFKPTLVLQPARDALSAANLKILLDSSASMSRVDDGEKTTRYGQSVDVLKNILPKVQSHAEIEYFTFADFPKQQANVKSVSAVKPAGKITDIVGAVRFSGMADKDLRPAAVLLISDGCHNALSTLAEMGRCRQSVFALGVGRADEKLNRPVGRGAMVENFSVPFVVPLNRETRITATVRMIDMAGRKCTAVLYEDTQPLGQVDITPAGSDVRRNAEFVWRPTGGQGSGDVRNLRVEVTCQDDADTNDNFCDAAVLIRRPAMKILIVEGTIRPEYKYLRRVLAGDANMQVASFVRMSENRFWAQGSIDGVEQKSLPSDEKDFRQFDVVILGDVAAEFFLPRQMEGMQNFVSAGGGIIMPGGGSSFSAGGWQDTPLADVLPVQMNAAGQIAKPFDMTLTATGVNHPIFVGLAKSFNSPAGRVAVPLPPLEGCVRTGTVKAAAELLAVNPAADNATVMAVQNYGKGRAAAFTADTTWRWYLSAQRMGESSPYVKFWLQTVRWLAGSETSKKDGKKIARVIVRSDRPCVRVGDGEVKFSGVIIDGDAANPLKVQYEIRGEGRYRQPVIFTANRAGELSASWTPQQPGEYELVRVSPDNASPRQIKIRIEQSDAENTICSRNDAFLSGVAAATDGFYTLSGNEDELAGRLINHLERLRNQAAKSSIKRIDAYNFPLILIMAVGLLTAEWVLRHKKSLR
ncbi:MAG TPA: glutamine amidotransferase [Phycisphaerae bacterium]|nr:glutamine amidotransferase [Phycisphaerae bacterium]